ncbi:regulatory iron-sulfur-containing complex subunit RicT [Dysgonomonas sp. 520]|uniref:PSP1 domain-containing protein n=1 Tax=Dysgonomonas sp. 520 TaxID=2302931 RepID=UPI0013D32D5F|nr:regulatory iron-sulfur-containing complex subunit RicT [Dysgonomonas sp. 520]NDW09456.1 hypothetical protein [Dysgonomonas sp. 520]
MDLDNTNQNTEQEPNKEEQVLAKKTEESTKCTCGKNPGETCGCKTGNGCQTDNKKNCDSCAKNGKCICLSGTHKLEVFDWLCDLPEAGMSTQMVEVQFKNTRKGYYLNSNNLELFKGDIVAVEASPGHDIGEVTLTGKLVLLQMKKSNYRAPNGEVRRVYRIAKPIDMEKYNAAKALEHKTMLRAREYAEELGLQMKISDVEYQGDGNKAIFYYIADERVDFRQLIKVYAEKFRVKIEMKQIGARQEAGRVGGIGPCGRELCCSSSISSFVSVSTSAARYQDISLNPLKLAGQCGKLKCCLNYEVDVYVEAQRKLPSKEVVLETKDSSYFHFKTDILSGMMTYSTDKHFAANLVTIDKERVYEIVRMNKRNYKPLSLVPDNEQAQEKNKPTDVLAQESITRFDNKPKKKKKKLSKNNNQGSRPAGENNGEMPAQTNEAGRQENNKPQRERRDENKNAATNANRNDQKKNFKKRNNKPNRNNNDKNGDKGNQTGDVQA